MGHKSWQRQRKPQLSLEELRERACKAQREGRFQQGLELARSLFKQDPSAENLEFCQQACLGRARQLKSQGYVKDAVTVLGNCADMGGDQAFLEEVAEELAACGEAVRAQKILERFPDSAAAEKLLACAVDAAMRHGSNGRSQVPESWRPQFDLVVQALTQVEANEDEAARAALQGIGLNSPFLEWKLLIRGLLAYHQNDDARAIENWQRLDPDRLPSRLAAPLRFLIDPAFRQGQTAAAQDRLQRAADRVQSSALITALRALQTLLSSDHDLGPAFRQAEILLPSLRQQAPHLAPRLAHCFYWAIVHHGLPNDMGRYTRLFGRPADDPKLTRMQALVLEQQGDWDQANEAWKDHEQDVIESSLWPADHKPLARALLWKRMGDNAAHHEEADGAFDDFPVTFKRRTPRPSAEACYRRSLELNPKHLETHQALAAYLLHAHRLQEAEQAGRDLLTHFPRHVETMKILAGLCTARKDFGEALHILEMAMQVNPLDRDLRAKASTAHVFLARADSEAGRFDGARGHFQAALDLGPDKGFSTKCKWAASEFKANNSGRAEELLQQAQESAPHPAGLAFQMVIEAIRSKLAAGLKKRFGQDWEAALAGPPSPTAAAAMIDCLAAHYLAGISYAGQQAHKKTVLAYFQKVPSVQFDQDQAERVCENLLILKAVKQVRSLALQCQKRFPAHPGFVLPQVKLEFDSRRRSLGYHTLDLLRRARKLAEVWPDAERRRAYLEVIKGYEEAFTGSHPLDPLAGAFRQMMGGMLDELMEDEDYD